MLCVNTSIDIFSLILIGIVRGKAKRINSKGTEKTVINENSQERKGKDGRRQKLENTGKYWKILEMTRTN